LAVEQTAPAPLTRSQEARRQRVIEAAMALATEGGYDAVQMRDVAARAHVAMGTIYRYFTSKDHLLSAAQVDWAAALQRRLDQVPARGPTTADRVVDVLRRATRSMERVPRLSAAFVTAMSSADPAAAECQREVAALVTATVDRAIGDADVPDRSDIIQVIGFVWYGALVAWSVGMNPVTQIGDELEQAARLLLR
jgi:TetR/AcrR family transcriptional regulator, cholesterol catabolism regulator